MKKIAVVAMAAATAMAPAVASAGYLWADYIRAILQGLGQV